MEDPKGYKELKAARAGTPGYDQDGEPVYMPTENDANHIRGRKVGSMIMDAIHETDQTQRLMHHMARVQIEATIKGMIENDMLQAKADWLNKAGVKQLAFLKHQLMQEPSHAAIAATLH